MIYIQLFITTAITIVFFLGLRILLRRAPANCVSRWFEFHHKNKSEIVIWSLFFVPILWCVVHFMGQ